MTESANEISRDQSALFPVDNPETTDGPGELPRRAEPMLRMLMDEFQKVFDVVMAYPKQVDGDKRAWMIDRMVNVFGQVYLLGAVRHFAPDDADHVAAELADLWDAGDSLGEWVYQWRQELDAGKPLTLPLSNLVERSVDGGLSIRPLTLGEIGDVLAAAGYRRVSVDDDTVERVHRLPSLGEPRRHVAERVPEPGAGCCSGSPRREPPISSQLLPAWELGARRPRLPEPDRAEAMSDLRSGVGWRSRPLPGR